MNQKKMKCIQKCSHILMLTKNSKSTNYSVKISKIKIEVYGQSYFLTIFLNLISVKNIIADNIEKNNYFHEMSMI